MQQASEAAARDALIDAVALDIIYEAARAATDETGAEVAAEVMAAAGLLPSGAQPHASKVLIGGNHDLVLQGLGAARVQRILDEQATPGRGPPPIYLEHSHTTLPCGLTVFGSPYADWSSHNNAFLARGGADFSAVPPRCDVVLTHMTLKAQQLSAYIS